MVYQDENRDLAEAQKSAENLPASGGVHFSAPFIKRPVATTLLSVAIILAGAVAYKLLPVASLPQVEYPVISVGAGLPGADPETMASAVATPLERQFAKIAGVNEMTSSSSTGQASITLQFDLSRDVNGAARDVQAAINAARSQLPSNLPNNPSYRKINPSDSPILILAALIVVYIVLGVLYESYIHPITILSTLPSAGVGAILALLIFHVNLSVIALIGIILLIGIVKKNAIMMIDFALEAEREHGMEPEEAIYQACLLRFRPIMMTTMAALLGGLPLALGTGTGSELRRPLGITIVGGLIVSQILTLFTTPVVYLFFDRIGRKYLHTQEADAELREHEHAVSAD